MKKVLISQTDSLFARMAGDDAYQEEARLILEEFDPAAWEALQLGEKQLVAD